MHPPDKMTKMTYSNEISCSAVAKICQDVGWHTAHKGALTTLAELLKKYIRDLSTIAVDFANHSGRNEPNIDDLAMTFNLINIDLNQIKDYVLSVESSPLPQKVPLFPLPCRENRVIDNYAPSDEERPECYEEWMPSLTHIEPSSLSLNPSSEQNQVPKDVMNNDKQITHLQTNGHLNENEAQATPVSESHKNKLVLRFSLSKSVDDSTETNHANADDDEANEANLSESALIAKHLKKSRAFQNFLNSSLYRNPTAPETKSTLRVADKQRLPNTYQSRENSPQPEPQSIRHNDASNDALNQTNDTKKAKRPKKKKNTVLDINNLAFGLFDDDPSATSIKVKDFVLKKERKSKSSDSTEKKPKKKLMPFSLKMPGIGIADDNANMFDFAEPGPFDLATEEACPKTKRQYKKKEKPPKVASEKRRGRPKKVQSTLTKPTELVLEDGKLPLSPSKIKEEGLIENVFVKSDATKLMINISGSNETGDQISLKRKIDDVGSADSMTDPNTSTSKITPKKIGRPLKRPKTKSSTTKKFAKSAEIIESSGDSSDDDINIDSNPVSLLPPLLEPTVIDIKSFTESSNLSSARKRHNSGASISSDSSTLSSTSHSLSKRASSMEHSGSLKAEKHSSNVLVSEPLDEFPVAKEHYHDSAKSKKSKHKTKKHSKHKDKIHKEKSHKKHKKDKLKKSKQDSADEREKKESKSKKTKEGSFGLTVSPPPDTEKVHKKEKKSETKSSKDFKIITETIQEDNTNEVANSEQWYCPVCNQSDVGMPMICCDKCLLWFHYTCVGLFVTPPEDQKWFCEKCKKKVKKGGKGKSSSLSSNTSDNSLTITPIPPVNLAAQFSSGSSTSVHITTKPFVTITPTSSNSSGYKPTGRPRGRPRKDSYQGKHQVTITALPLPPPPTLPIPQQAEEEEELNAENSKSHCGVCFQASSKYEEPSNWVACDECDQWYHFECQGITEAPSQEESWFCRKCIEKQRTIVSRLRI